ncbi:hypothetical protein H6G93_08130 [Nostoc sp. FACHB-973]|nr:hypothetical protein [Nostoc sp. FACHB-973]
MGKPKPRVGFARVGVVGETSDGLEKFDAVAFLRPSVRSLIFPSLH